MAYNDELAIPNVFGYAEGPAPTSVFNEWKDRNVAANIAATGDPNSFNMIGTNPNEPSTIQNNTVAAPPQNLNTISTNRLTELANRVNGNPNTTDWAPSDIAKANEFSIYGNQWNKSMNTPGLKFDYSQTDNNKVAKPTQVLNNSGQSYTQVENKTPEFFDGYGNKLYNSEYFDASGNKMTRADLEQMKNMSLARDLAYKAMAPDNRQATQEIVGYTDPQFIKGKHGGITQVGGGQPIYQMVQPTGESKAAAAARALNALSPLVGTIPGYQKDLAAANTYNTTASLAGEKTAAENKKDLAIAAYQNSLAESNKAENDYLMKNADIILGKSKPNNNRISMPPQEQNSQFQQPVFYQYQKPTETATSRLQRILGMGR